MTFHTLYLLKCWHKIVSGGSEFLQIQEYPFKKQHIKKDDPIAKEEIKGFFACYPEGIFCWYKNNSGALFISWNGKRQVLGSIDTIQWTSEMWGRHFVARDKQDKIVMDFRYQTAKGLFFSHPFEFIVELFCPDDDWGLVGDLPSFVDSCFNDNTIFDSFESILEERNYKNIDPQLLSDAVLVWTGWSQDMMPRRDDALLTVHFGPKAATVLLSVIKKLENDFYTSTAKYTADNLQEMKKLASDEFRKKHSEIPTEVIKAFAWCYTFDFK